MHPEDSTTDLLFHCALVHSVMIYNSCSAASIYVAPALTRSGENTIGTGVFTACSNVLLYIP